MRNKLILHTGAQSLDPGGGDAVIVLPGDATYRFPPGFSTEKNNGFWFGFSSHIFLMFRKISGCVSQTAEPALTGLILGDRASALGKRTKPGRSGSAEIPAPRPSGHTDGLQGERRAKAQQSHP